MTHDLKMRLQGLGALAFSLAFAWHEIYLPLQAAKAQHPEVEVHDGAPFFISPLLLYYGVGSLLLGARANWHDPSRTYPGATPIGIVTIVLTVITTLALRFWVGHLYTLYGYRF